MKLQLMSDLHFDFHRDKGVGLIDSLDPTAVDVLILAGDITNVLWCGDRMKRFCDKYPHVVMVPGNHEYYDSSFDRVREDFGKVDAALSNFHYLDNKTTTIDGQRFAGTTLWFEDGPTNNYMKKGLNDFNWIADFEFLVYQENAKAMKFLNSTVQSSDVVITHHLPSPECIAEEYKHGMRAMFNIFYVCDMTNLILDKQPKLWCHGHTHNRLENMIGNTRCVSNALGYPRESTGYEDKLIIEV